MKKHNAYLLAGSALCVLGLISLGSGCELITSVDRSQINEGTGGTGGAGGQGGMGGMATGGMGGMGGMGGTGGVAGMGGQGGTGGGGMVCQTPADCPTPASECVQATCDNGVCGTMNLATGTAAATQTANDCKLNVCDGNGAVISQNDDTDTLDDGKECTADTCNAGIPTSTPVAQGIMCTEGGGKVCNAAGACVECNVGADCASGVCQAGVCQSAQCGDGQKNGTETDIDCGGSCGPCADGLVCGMSGDCQSGVCTGGTCAVPACNDNVQNGSETDKDCGGSCPADCADGLKCSVAGDCQSNVCAAGMCAMPACNDGTQNGSESDVDCGGSCAADCADGLKCGMATDCQSGVCTGGTCAMASCSDTVKNGAETDVDCGGGACPGCMDGQACAMGTDCMSTICNPMTNVCAQMGCMDGIKNGAETDVDCGGGTCGACTTGKACSIDGDCASNMCYGNKCVASVNGCDVATANDMTMSGTATVTFANGNFSYAPKCLKVKAGTIITFNGSFTNHPLQGGEVTGGMEVPSAVGPFKDVTNTGTTMDFTMSAAGTFPYYCVPHGVSQNMTGAVFVVP